MRNVLDRLGDEAREAVEKFRLWSVEWSVFGTVTIWPMHDGYSVAFREGADNTLIAEVDAPADVRGTRRTFQTVDEALAFVIPMPSELLPVEQEDRFRTACPTS